LAVAELAHTMGRASPEETIMRPNPERQIHRACGDVRAALFSALELLADGNIPTTAGDDTFKVLSDVGRLQRHLADALQATNLLDQMVGVPAEERPPWSYYRSRIGKKPPCGLSAVDADHLAGQATAS
jgi:hypothetical protein